MPTNGSALFRNVARSSTAGSPVAAITSAISCVNVRVIIPSPSQFFSQGGGPDSSARSSMKHDQGPCAAT